MCLTLRQLPTGRAVNALEKVKKRFTKAGAGDTGEWGSTPSERPPLTHQAPGSLCQRSGGAISGRPPRSAGRPSSRLPGSRGVSERPGRLSPVVPQLQPVARPALLTCPPSAAPRSPPSRPQLRTPERVLPRTSARPSHVTRARTAPRTGQTSPRHHVRIPGVAFGLQNPAPRRRVLSVHFIHLSEQSGLTWTVEQVGRRDGASGEERSQGRGSPKRGAG